MIGAPDIPGLTLLDVLGHGGFSTVYRAHQHSVDREVAVKVDHRLLATDRDRRRYLREVSAAGRLSGHPHVVSVYDAGTLPDGRPYLVMDLCPGGSLDRVLKREGPLPVDRVLGYGVQLADALSAAHDAGVLHRDIKPGNLLIDRYGAIGLADFGLASILSADREQSVTREALTPAYACPETFALAEPTPAADLYSLGATLYALLSGRPPRFPTGPAPSIATVLALHEQPIPDLPGVPAAVTAVLRRAMEHDPAHRPADAAELRDQLAAVQASSSGSSSRRSPRPAAPDRVPAAGRAAPGHHPGSADTLAAPGLPTRQDRSTPGRGSTAGRGRPAGRGTAGAAVAAAALAIGGSLFVLLKPDPGPGPAIRPATSTPAAAGAAATRAADYGVPVSTDDCPAAGVPGAGAVCPAEPECWAGLNVVAGSATSRSVQCTQAHTWQTFAITLMPGRLTGFDQLTAAADPTVAALCNRTVLLASRTVNGQALPTDGWTAETFPPSEARFAGGDRVLRCLGGRGLDQLDRPVFDP